MFWIIWGRVGIGQKLGDKGRVWRKQELGPQLAGVLNAKGRVLLET